METNRLCLLSEQSLCGTFEQNYRCLFCLHFLFYLLSFQPIMDLEVIFSIAKELYALCQKVKANKKQCRRLARRVKGLEGLLAKVRRKEVGMLTVIH